MQEKSWKFLNRIKEQVENNKVIIYMKGTPQMPQCGFSSKTSERLNIAEQKFAYVDILKILKLDKLPKISRLANLPSSLFKWRIHRWM